MKIKTTLQKAFTSVFEIYVDDELDDYTDGSDNKEKNRYISDLNKSKIFYEQFAVFKVRKYSFKCTLKL